MKSRHSLQRSDLPHRQMDRFLRCLSRRNAPSFQLESIRRQNTARYTFVDRLSASRRSSAANQVETFRSYPRPELPPMLPESRPCPVPFLRAQASHRPMERNGGNLGPSDEFAEPHGLEPG